MKEIVIEDNKFLCFEYCEAKFVFSTAENNLNFNKSLSEGLNNIQNLKTWFNLKDVGYCNQIHSDLVNVFSNSNEDGDALITNSIKTAIGVFTADCVPVLLFDSVNKVVSAVHSGWRSTVKGIVSNTIEKMISQFGTDPENVIVYIGPHNRQCCYEVGQEVIDEFTKNITFQGTKYIDERNISLSVCIEKQLTIKGVKKENIHDIEICTYCSEEHKLHSYRKCDKNYGRMFSFVYLND